MIRCAPLHNLLWAIDGELVWKLQWLGVYQPISVAYAVVSGIRCSEDSARYNSDRALNPRRFA
jgi:hypothetical protein